MFAGVNSGQAELSPFSQVIYAGCDKVDEDKGHPYQIQAVLKALQKVSGNKTRQAFDWQEWRVFYVRPNFWVTQ